jgi:hypothetical protein
MHGAIPPLPQYVFMAWCSVKKTAETTLLLTYHPLVSECMELYLHFSRHLYAWLLIKHGDILVFTLN